MASAKGSVKDGIDNIDKNQNDDEANALLEQLAKRLMDGVEIKDRRYHLQTYPSCFLGTEACDWMIQEGLVGNVEDAVILGQQLMDDKYIYHVTRDERFSYKKFFYRFVEHDDHGKSAKNESGKAFSWANMAKFLPGGNDDNEDDNKDSIYGTTAAADSAAASTRNTDMNLVQHTRIGSTGTGSSNEPLISPSTLLKEIEVYPLDEHNVKLLDNVHPAQWKNPLNPTEPYTLLVVGAGAGGLVSAAGAAGVGAKVALIEQHLMGGDCLNYGCVPSKALIRAARAVKEVKTAAQFGVKIQGEIHVDFSAIMERMRKIRAQMSSNDSCTRFTHELGVDVYQGHAQFIGKKQVRVKNQILTFKRAIIATGASAAIPNIPGLKEAPFLTNATIFNLTHLPPTMCVVGGGPVGLELAQAFARFGSTVHVFIRGSDLLPKEDRDAAQVIHDALLDDGVQFHFNTVIQQVSFTSSPFTNLSSTSVPSSSSSPPPPPSWKYQAPFPEIHLELMSSSFQQRNEKAPRFERFTCQALLLATGRAPNVHGLGLEKAHVDFDTQRGVLVNSFMQTSNASIYAVGDVCSPFQFTHVADFMARHVLRNALFMGQTSFASLLVPWTTFTEPEVAHVGWYPRDLEQRKIPFDTYLKPWTHVDRAMCDGDVKGFVKIHCKKGSDIILGATIVHSMAGNLISEVTLAMQQGVGLGKLASVIHPYPTHAEALRQCGDLFNKTRLTPNIKGLLKHIANR